MLLYLKKFLIPHFIILEDFKQNSEFSALLQKSESGCAKSALLHGDISGGGVTAVSPQSSHVCPFTRRPSSGSHMTFTGLLGFEVGPVI